MPNDPLPISVELAQEIGDNCYFGDDPDVAALIDAKVRPLVHRIAFLESKLILCEKCGSVKDIPLSEMCNCPLPSYSASTIGAMIRHAAAE